MHGEEQEQNTGRLAYLAELQCFMCGSMAGSIETDRKPLPPYGIWHPAGGGPAQRVADRPGFRHIAAGDQRNDGERVVVDERRRGDAEFHACETLLPGGKATF